MLCPIEHRFFSNKLVEVATGLNHLVRLTELFAEIGRCSVYNNQYVYGQSLRKPVGAGDIS